MVRVLALVVWMLVLASCGEGDVVATSEPPASGPVKSSLAPTSTSSTVDRDPTTSTGPTTTVAEPTPTTTPPTECTLLPSETPPTQAGEQLVTVLFQCGGFDAERPDVSTAVVRVMAADLQPVEATLRALLAGPTPEERSGGVGSFFTIESANALNAVVVQDGVASIDFNDGIFINNASTSTGSLFFMAELRANVFQYPGVHTITWSVDGDCLAFGDWLQVGECMVDTRSTWEAFLGENLDEVGTSPDPEQYSTATLGRFPSPLEGGEGAHGSGCAPGTTSLPDGAWFGFVRGRNPGSIGFDLACFWTGDRANEAALAAGETDVPVPNDYYISNVSDQLREAFVEPGVLVAHLDYTEQNTSGDPYVEITFAEWGGLNDYLTCDFTDPDDRTQFCPVWLFVNGGVVTEIVEQYVP